LETGSELRNNISGNIVVQSHNSSYFDLSDLGASGIYITNPSNRVTMNAIFASAFDGVTYIPMELPSNTLALAELCPIGLSVLSSFRNVIHSNHNNGITIYELILRDYPCESDSSIVTLVTSPINEFSNYTIWGNRGTGLNIYKIGGCQFNNITLIQNSYAGVSLCFTNLSSTQNILQSSKIIGFSNYSSSNFTNNSQFIGVLTPVTDGLLINQTQFTNFGPQMTIIQPNTNCPLTSEFIPDSTIINTTNISLSNNQGNYINWNGREDII
jgi:hypothetical protein